MERDFSKLHGRIVEKYRNLTGFSREIGVPVSVISAKLKGKKPITEKDILKWMGPLNITTDAVGEYFFAFKV